MIRYPMLKRSMSSAIPKTFKSIIYSSHNAEDCTQVLKVHSYEPKIDLDNTIVLKNLAFPINPSDINQLQGVYPSKPEKTLQYSTTEPSAIAGNEGVFEIIHLPLETTSNNTKDNLQSFQKGDWVIPLQANQGTWSNYRTINDPKQLIKVNGLDLFTAATVSVNGVTAYQLVNNFVDWSNPDKPENEWLIQNAGTSGVSKLVSQIAKARGIKTLSVIRDRNNFNEVAKILEDKYGATKVISESQNNDKSFAKGELHDILGPNASIKLALNSVGGKSSAAIARKLVNNSKMITYGGMSKQPVTVATSLHIFKGLTSLGYWVTELNKKNPEIKIDTVKNFIKLYNDKKIISPKDDLNILKWDVKNFTDAELLELIKYGINNKNNKNVVVLDWE